jgi:hypothetical protein
MAETKMPGRNTLVWNLATIVKAVQEYLDAHGGVLFADVVVEDVSQASASGGIEFRITVVGDDE